MAETKTKAAETETKAAETENKLVKIKLPIDRNDKHNTHQFVYAGGKSYLIERGVEVEVPYCVEEVLRHSEETIDRAYHYTVKNAVDE